MPSLSQHPYLQKIIFEDPLSEELSIPIYGAMLALWHCKPHLQRRFPLHRGESKDYWRWSAWCATQGLKESAVLRELVAWEKTLAAPVALPALSSEEIWQEGFSLKMFFQGMAHYGYTFASLLKNPRARHHVATHYWRGGRHRGKQDVAAAWHYSFLKKQFGTLACFLETLKKGASELQEETSKLEHGARKMSCTQEQLVKAWKLEDVAAAFEETSELFERPSALAIPKKTESASSFFLSKLPARLLSCGSASAAWLQAKPTEKESARVTQLIVLQKKSTKSSHAFDSFQKKENKNSATFGVNLFGYARGEFGLGEDLRQLAKAFQAHEIPFCILNVSLKKSFSQEDHSMDPWITDQPRYGINLFCMNGVEMAKLLLQQGLHVLENRYTIGLWPWELPNWPKSCHYAFASVDELWAISSYTAHAYRHAPCPVQKMTPPVSIEKIGPQQRLDFGLPQHAYLYLFCFDLHSRIARKNPWGLVRAFQKAFPHQNAQEVGLVLKVSHSRSWRWPWPLIRLLAQGDTRIHLLEKSMRHDELFALYRACDCYVSLHRAEGFGRTIAEALLLGLQVVTTRFSGNLDFCKEPRVALVQQREQVLKADDYFWGEGEYWANPCLKDAARLLQAVRTSPRNTLTPIIDLSPAMLGQYYAKRLRKIWTEGC